jgi:hypothetical protein
VSTIDGLQAALDGKAAAAHTHSGEEITSPVALAQNATYGLSLGDGEYRILSWDTNYGWRWDLDDYASEGWLRLEFVKALASNSIAASSTTFLRGDGTWATSPVTKSLCVFTPEDNQPPATNFATSGTRNSLRVLEFDAATQESAQFCGVIPEGTNVSNGLMVRLWWMGATATSGNVRWGVSFERANTDMDTDSFSAVTQFTSGANGISGFETIQSVTAAAGFIDGITAGDRFRLRVARIAADATNDTMTGDAQLVAVEVRVP